jgi:hypothetical protein
MILTFPRTQLSHHACYDGHSDLTWFPYYRGTFLLFEAETYDAMILICFQ